MDFVIFFFSSEEDFETVVGEMLEIIRHGPSLAVAMCGSKGSVCMDSSGICKYQITPEEEIVDTLGAGDSYIAGFTAGMLKGEPPEKCMERGAALASQVIGRFYPY